MYKKTNVYLSWESEGQVVIRNIDRRNLVIGTIQSNAVDFGKREDLLYDKDNKIVGTIKLIDGFCDFKNNIIVANAEVNYWE